MLTEKKIFVSRIALLVDLSAIILAFPVAYHTQGLLIDMLFKTTKPISEYIWLVFLVACIWMVLLVLRRMHHYFSILSTIRELVREITLVSLLGSFLLMGILFILNIKLNRSLVFLYIFYLTIYLLFFKVFFQSYLVWLSKSGKACRNVLIVGAGKIAAKIIRGIGREPALGMNIVGCVVRSQKVGKQHFKGVPVIGTVDELSDIMHRIPVDEVILAITPNALCHFREVLGCCEEMGITCRVSSGLLTAKHTEPLVEDLFGISFVSYYTSRKPLNLMFIKYAFDFLASLVLLIVAAPAIFLISLIIRLTSKGPAFFIQERHGLNGRRFNMFKFRTMVVNAEEKKALLAGMNEMSGPVFKITNDPRVTMVGRFLRKTSLDELPQLLNVLRGEMSLVGPRPLPLSESAEITGPLRRRLSMKPGLTCLWQISGRNDIDFNDWMKLDMEYIDRWSLKLDLRILLKTIPVVIRGKGAK
jgi:exopolysaccharide biosynthesis polyprenyl glycosylphosphotransferase